MRVFTPAELQPTRPMDEFNPDFFARVKQPPRETFFTGQEHSHNFAYYASEDEVLGDGDVSDTVALQAWRDQNTDDENRAIICY
jgi:hypothetical protein